MEFLFIWVLFAVACYYLARSKGRNAGGWAVAGLFFGVFALIVLAFLPKRQIFQHPYLSQPGTYGVPPFTGQAGYGVPHYGAPSAPSYVPPPVHPQHVPPPVHPQQQATHSRPQHVPPPVHPQHQSRTPTTSAPIRQNEQQPAVGSVSVELARLGALHRSGQLSDSDFEAAKRRLLGS